MLCQEKDAWKARNLLMAKLKKPKRPQYKGGRNPRIKDGLGHTHGGKTHRRKVINRYECVQFMSKRQKGIDRSAQMVAQGQPRAAPLPMGGSAAPTEKGRPSPPPLLMSSPRRRCLILSRLFRNQRNLSGSLQIDMLINQRQKHLLNVWILTLFCSTTVRGGVCQVCWQWSKCLS